MIAQTENVDVCEEPAELVKRLVAEFDRYAPSYELTSDLAKQLFALVDPRDNSDLYDIVETCLGSAQRLDNLRENPWIAVGKPKRPTYEQELATLQYWRERLDRLGAAYQAPSASRQTKEPAELSFDSSNQIMRFGDWQVEQLPRRVFRFLQILNEQLGEYVANNDIRMAIGVQMVHHSNGADQSIYKVVNEAKKRLKEMSLPFEIHVRQSHGYRLLRMPQKR